MYQSDVTRKGKKTDRRAMAIPKPNGEDNLLASLLLYKWEALNMDVFTVQTLNVWGIDGNLKKQDLGQ